MLSFKNIALKVGEKSLFQIDDLELGKGMFALVGRNGTGKTTFLRTIMKSDATVVGEIAIDGLQMNTLSSKEKAKRIAIVPSKPELFGNHSAKEVLMLGRIPYQSFLSRVTEKDEVIVSSVIDKLHLNELLNRTFNTLSDGEKQLIMIGRALVQETGVILLDEPGAFLDLVNRVEILNVLKEIAETENKLVIFSTHHIDSLEKYCDGVLLIAEAKMHFLTDKKSYLEQIHNAFNIAN